MCTSISRRPISSRTTRKAGDSKVESTVRYLGIEVDDAIEIERKIDI